MSEWWSLPTMLLAALAVLLLAAFLGLTALVTWMLGRRSRTEKPARRWP